MAIKCLLLITKINLKKRKRREIHYSLKAWLTRRKQRKRDGERERLIINASVILFVIDAMIINCGPEDSNSYVLSDLHRKWRKDHLFTLD